MNRTVAPVVALRVARRIADEWSIDYRQLAAALGRKMSTVQRWYEKPPNELETDVFERIVLLVGIYDALHTVFSDHAYANQWVRVPNRGFRGESPIALIVAGGLPRLMEVHRYLLSAITERAPCDR